MDEKSEERMLKRAVETLLEDLPFGLFFLALLGIGAYGLWLVGCEIVRMALSHPLS